LSGGKSICTLQGVDYFGLPHSDQRTTMSRRKYGFSFSWKRALGISAAKGRLSRQLGIPLTRQGRQRKMGQLMGCCIPLAAFLLTSSAAVVWACWS
jgi:hypothetical protein